MNWKKFKEEKPSEGEEVLAYHPSWIDALVVCVQIASRRWDKAFGKHSL